MVPPGRSLFNPYDRIVQLWPDSLTIGREMIYMPLPIIRYEDGR